MKTIKLALGFLLVSSLITISAQDTTTKSETRALYRPAPSGMAKSTASSFLDSFYNFVRVFVTLMTNEKVQNSIKNIEQMIANLIQLAYQAIYLNQNNATQEPQPETLLDAPAELQAQTDPAEIAKRLVINPALQDGMLRAIMTHSQSITRCTITRAQIEREETDETTVKVLTGFGAIVQNFFNIVQDPENEKNVTPNLASIIANIISIGVEVTKRNMLPVLGDNNAIADYVINGIDPRLKNDMLAIFRLTVHRAEV